METGTGEWGKTKRTATWKRIVGRDMAMGKGSGRTCHLGEVERERHRGIGRDMIDMCKPRTCNNCILESNSFSRASRIVRKIEASIRFAHYLLLGGRGGAGRNNATASMCVDEISDEAKRHAMCYFERHGFDAALRNAKFSHNKNTAHAVWICAEAKRSGTESLVNTTNAIIF